jgi:hypothetical protein
MVRSAERIHIPNLDSKFVRDRNPENNWLIAEFNENISLLDELAGNLPRKLPWRRSVLLEGRDRDRRLEVGVRNEYSIVRDTPLRELLDERDNPYRAQAQPAGPRVVRGVEKPWRSGHRSFHRSLIAGCG